MDRDPPQIDFQSISNGGLIFSLMRWMRASLPEGKHFPRQIVVIIAITWLPLFVLSFFGGAGSNQSLRFWQDFETQIRFLILLPFLVVGMKLIEPAYRYFFNGFDHLIAEHERAVYETILDSTLKLSRSLLPELVTLAVILSILIFHPLSDEGLHNSWRNAHATRELSPTLAGWYYYFVSLPIYQLFMARWIWLWIVWAISVARLARLRLVIDAMHADEMGGLQFVERVPITFVVLSISLAISASSQLGMEIVYGGSTLMDYRVDILLFVILIPTVIYSPLFAFSLKMSRIRHEAILRFGELLHRHNVAYRQKWLDPNADLSSLLGSADNSSLADINGSYQAVKGMNIIPFESKRMLYSAILLCLPFLPLLATMYSITDLIKRVVGAFLGS